MSKQYNLKDIYKIGKSKGIILEDITYEEFSTIARDFNKAISDKILNNAYKFNFGIGIIEVKRGNRKGLSIDWNSSKKLKQEIIDRGEVPFSKETAPDGVKWFVYFDSKDYFKWKWFKAGVQFIKNAKYYIFKPMTGNRRKIAQMVKSKPFADIEYGIYK